METYSFVPRKYRRIFLVAVSVLSLSLMAVSVNHKHYNSFACYGLLGEGHPFDFLCDYSDGAIPLAGPAPQSAGVIDLLDVPYFSAQGVIMDFLFYCALILAAWFVVTYSIHKAIYKNREFSKG